MVAFTRNAANLLALKTEVNTDPITMGYVPANTSKVLNDLNLKSRNVGLETAVKMFTPRLILTHITPGQIDAVDFTSDGRKFFFELVMQAGAVNMDTNLDEFRAQVLNVLPDGTGKTDLTNDTETITRAEVLFERYIVITREDWIAARDS